MIDNSFKSAIIYGYNTDNGKDIRHVFFKDESVSRVKCEAERILNRDLDYYVILPKYVVVHAMNAAEARYHHPWRLFGPLGMRNRMARPLFAGSMEDTRNDETGIDTPELAREHILRGLQSKAVSILVSSYMEKHHTYKWARSHAEPVHNTALTFNAREGCELFTVSGVKNLINKRRPTYELSGIKF